MKSDFRKFRLYCRLAFVFLLLAIGALVCSMVLSILGDVLGATISITVLIVIGAVGVTLEWSAYDNLLCPKCGQRIAIPHRDSFDKENRARYRAIAQGEPVVCVHCDATIKTK